MAKHKFSPEIQDSSDGPLAKNQAVLARELGVSVQCIGLWVKEEQSPTPRTDKRYAINAWKAWMERYGKASSAKVSGSTTAKHAVQMAILEETRRQKKFDNDVAEGQYVAWDEVVRVYSDMAHGFAEALKREKHELAQNLSGLDTPELTKRLGESARRILQELSLGEWGRRRDQTWSRLYAQQSDLLKSAIRGSGLSEM
jgi:hypothetical protein